MKFWGYFNKAPKKHLKCKAIPNLSQTPSSYRNRNVCESWGELGYIYFKFASSSPDTE